MNKICCEEKLEHKDLQEKARKNEFDDDLICRLSNEFRVLGDEGRLKILSTLLGGKLCVCDIIALTNKTQSAVSHQLRILKDNGIVKSNRVGKSIFYSLKDEHIEEIIKMAKIHLECR